MENIRRLLEITEAERNHELLLTVKNLRELGGSPFPYIIPIVPRSLPVEVIKGEHFVLANLLKLVPDSFSQPIPTLEDQTRAAARTLVRSDHVTHPQSPQAAPQPAKKNETRIWQSKAVSAELEDFLDWMGMIYSEPVEEEEMFSLAAGFSTRRRKQPTTLEGVATSSSGEKRPRRSPLDEEAQKDGAIVLVESLDLASNDQPALGDCPVEANIPLEEEVPIVNPPSVEEVGMGAPSGVVIAPAPPPKPPKAKPSKKRLPNQVLVSMYVPPLERIHPSTDMVAPNLEDVLKIVRRWSPLNQEESPVTLMHNLYPNYFRMPVNTCSEQ